jgi:hypothetical protein
MTARDGTARLQQPARRAALWAALALAATVLVTLSTLYLPAGVDWHFVNRPGALALIQGQSPYEAVPNFSSPPWGVLLMAPLAVLPEALGRALLLLLSLGAFAYAAFRLEASPLALGAFLLSPPVLHCLLNANLDFLVLLGFVLPPPIGMFFISVKPQVGGLVGLFWCVNAWRQDRWRGLLRVAGPIGLAYLVSFALYGFWPSHYLGVARYSQGWNSSVFPLAIPVGLALTVQALRTRQIRWVLPASVCLSPYVLFHSYSAALIALTKNTPAMLAAVAGLWVVIALRVLGY